MPDFHRLNLIFMWQYVYGYKAYHLRFLIKHIMGYVFLWLLGCGWLKCLVYIWNNIAVGSCKALITQVKFCVKICI